MPFKSPLPDVSIPDVDIWSFLFNRPERPFPDSHVLLKDPGTAQGGSEPQPTALSYDQIRTSSIAFGRGLVKKLRFKKGDVALVFAPNSIHTPVLSWGALWAGAVVSLANPTYTAEELAFQLKDSSSRIVLTRAGLVEIATKAAELAGIAADMVFVMGDDVPPAGSRARNVRHLMIAEPGDEKITKPHFKMHPSKDLSFLAYSSGTTGLPKGVILTHTNIIANILQIQRAEETPLRWNGGVDGKGDHVLGFLPIYHIYGLVVVVHASFYKGLPLLLMSGFNLQHFCANIQQYKAAFVYAVPPVVLLLAKHPLVDKYDLSSVQMINSGAAPLPVDLIGLIRDRLGIPIKQGYGLTEASPTTHVQSWNDHLEAVGSVGKMLSNLEAKITDPSGNEVAQGEEGEIFLRGPNIFQGYLNLPDQTAHAISPDRFFRTGDIGYVDKSGFFFITGRTKELIKYKGFQVPPAELEGLLIKHEQVDDAAVVGVNDPSQATELPKAYVVLKSSVAAEAGQDSVSLSKKADELARWIAQQVAPHKRLRGGVVFVDQIPKSAAGKILRRVLQEKAAHELKLQTRERL